MSSWGFCGAFAMVGRQLHLVPAECSDASKCRCCTAEALELRTEQKALLQALESVEVDWLPWVGDLFTNGNDFEPKGCGRS